MENSPKPLRKTKNLTGNFDDSHTKYKNSEKSPVPIFIVDLQVEVTASYEKLKPLCSTKTQDTTSEVPRFNICIRFSKVGTAVQTEHE